MPARTAATASTPEPSRSASTTSATPGATPTSAASGKLRSAASLIRSHFPSPVRPIPAVNSRKNGRVSGWG